jgi:galactonate dehydratase
MDRQVLPRVLGRDPRDMGALFVELRALGAAGASAGFAVSGLEQALWDLAGQAAGLPIWRLLGGRLRARLWTYASITRATAERSPAGFAATARAAVAQGFRAVKLAAFDDVPPGLDTPEAFAAVELGIERLQAVREAVGPRVQVMVDCHTRFTPAWAIRVARRLEPVRLFWLEDPVPRHDLEGLARVRDAVEVPIAAGETLFGRDAYWDLVRRRAIDVALPDVRHCGGIGELVRIAALAEPAQIRVAPHNPGGPVGTAAVAQAVATLPNFAILEYLFGDVPWRASLVTPAESIAGGSYTVPDAPGLGLRLNEEVLAAHSFPIRS